MGLDVSKLEVEGAVALSIGGLFPIVYTAWTVRSLFKKNTD